LIMIRQAIGVIGLISQALVPIRQLRAGSILKGWPQTSIPMANTSGSGFRSWHPSLPQSCTDPGRRLLRDRPPEFRCAIRASPNFNDSYLISGALIADEQGDAGFFGAVKRSRSYIIVYI